MFMQMTSVRFAVRLAPFLALPLLGTLAAGCGTRNSMTRQSRSSKVRTWLTQSRRRGPLAGQRNKIRAQAESRQGTRLSQLSYRPLSRCLKVSCPGRTPLRPASFLLHTAL